MKNDRNTASPTESAVRLVQADREHSGAGILNRMDLSRNIREARVTCQGIMQNKIYDSGKILHSSLKWSAVFSREDASMRVVPRCMVR